MIGRAEGVRQSRRKRQSESGEGERERERESRERERERARERERESKGGSGLSLKSLFSPRESAVYLLSTFRRGYTQLISDPHLTIQGK